jgi:hypothetical protein
MIFTIDSPKYGKFEVLIDNEDWKEVKKHKWSINNPSKRAKYVRSSKHILLHRYIMNASKDKEVDHINGNPLDNRKQNLRICNKNENSKNRKVNINSSSGYRGVYWDMESNKWAVAISFNKKRIKIGRFKRKTDAALIYNEVALKYHGEFARLNEVII